MKKLLSIGLALTLIFAFSSIAFAGEVTHDLVDSSSVSIQEFTVIYTGTPLLVTAITPKYGSYVESENFSTQQGALVVSNNDRTLQYINNVNSYVSTAIFLADKAGTYTVTYTIVMGAGKSDVQFISNATSEEITVIDKTPILVGIDFLQYSKKAAGINWQVKGWIVYNYSDGSSVQSSDIETFTYKQNATYDIVKDGFTYTLR